MIKQFSVWTMVLAVATCGLPISAQAESFSADIIPEGQGDPTAPDPALAPLLVELAVMEFQASFVAPVIPPNSSLSVDPASADALVAPLEDSTEPASDSPEPTDDDAVGIQGIDLGVEPVGSDDASVGSGSDDSLLLNGSNNQLALAAGGDPPDPEEWPKAVGIGQTQGPVDLVVEELIKAHLPRANFFLEPLYRRARDRIRDRVPGIIQSILGDLGKPGTQATINFAGNSIAIGFQTIVGMPATIDISMDVKNKRLLIKTTLGGALLVGVDRANGDTTIEFKNDVKVTFDGDGNVTKITGKKAAVTIKPKSIEYKVGDLKITIQTKKEEETDPDVGTTKIEVSNGQTTGSVETPSFNDPGFTGFPMIDGFDVTTIESLLGSVESLLMLATEELAMAAAMAGMPGAEEISTFSDEDLVTIAAAQAILEDALNDPELYADDGYEGEIVELEMLPDEEAAGSDTAQSNDGDVAASGDAPDATSLGDSLPPPAPSETLTPLPDLPLDPNSDPSAHPAHPGPLAAASAITPVPIPGSTPGPAHTGPFPDWLDAAIEHFPEFHIVDVDISQDGNSATVEWNRTVPLPDGNQNFRVRSYQRNPVTHPPPNDIFLRAAIRDLNELADQVENDTIEIEDAFYQLIHIEGGLYEGLITYQNRGGNLEDLSNLVESYNEAQDRLHTLGDGGEDYYPYEELDLFNGTVVPT